MKQLKVAFLWHQHQPYYKWENEFILPWVRLHGVKDYFDLPCLLKQYPSIKQTFNFAPSLMIQIEEYIKGSVKDRVQILSEKPAAELSDLEKTEILKQFFVCNLENLIKPLPRYFELHQIAEASNNSITSFSTQDFLDLQVFYNIAWIGEISKQDERISLLLEKGSDFTEEDKRYVLYYHIEVLKKISSIMNELRDRGQIEISCSPEYHPILPILIDHRSALEAMPWLDLSSLYFKYPEDAKAQLMKGLEIYENIFGIKPDGVWPSEGSLSDASLDLIADQNIKWVATDEQMLKETAKSEFFDTLKFFPQKYKNEETGKEVLLLFRDHFLSDRIGFVYSNWDPKNAAEEFCSHLDSIRNEIIRVHSEDALDYATVTVILDGENCWEFYKNNGFPFLNHLFGLLSDSDRIKTVTCSEAVQNFGTRYSKTYNHIHSGSWINANFSIWIGHSHDITAWKMLSKVRNEVESRKNVLPAELLAEVMDEIYIAEGSDWFWWYGPEHHAPNKADFDVLFRNHIDRIYKLIGLDTPLDVFIPIGSNEEYKRFEAASEKVTPACNGLLNEVHQWEGAAIFNSLGGLSTMHQIGELVTQMIFGNDESFIYFRLTFVKPIESGDEIFLTIDESFVLRIFSTGIEVLKSDETFELHKFAMNEVCDICLHTVRNYAKHKIMLELKSISNGNSINYNHDSPISYYFM